MILLRGILMNMRLTIISGKPVSGCLLWQFNGARHRRRQPLHPARGREYRARAQALDVAAGKAGYSCRMARCRRVLTATARIVRSRSECSARRISSLRPTPL